MCYGTCESNRAGWCLFSKELDSFLVGSYTVGVEGRIYGGVAGGGQMDGVDMMGRNFSKLATSGR